MACGKVIVAIYHGGKRYHARVSETAATKAREYAFHDTDQELVKKAQRGIIKAVKAQNQIVGFVPMQMPELIGHPKEKN